MDLENVKFGKDMAFIDVWGLFFFT